ncbi:MAG: universal stress protein [Desulfuromonadales bacterium]|nr:universal stress protein [Desulfuromonadales bacterium]
MHRFKKILFVSSGDKEDGAALDRVNRLALGNQAKVCLVRLVEELPFAAGLLLARKKTEEFREASTAHAQDELDRLKERFDPAVKVETRVVVGKSFVELIRMVSCDGYDLLVKPRERHQRRKSLASVDLHLLRKCPCPVWIIKPAQRKPFGKILIAVDADPSDAERLQMHQDLLKLGFSLADTENGKVEIAHTWTVEGETLLRSPRFGMTQAEIDVLEKEIEKTHRRWLDELLAPHRASKPRTTLVKGESGPALVELIDKKKPDIVVMGTVARTGLPGLLIGNTAEYVLGQIGCSVLAIKPQGFQTPVD